MILDDNDNERVVYLSKKIDDGDAQEVIKELFELCKASLILKAEEEGLALSALEKVKEATEAKLVDSTIQTMNQKIKKMEIDAKELEPMLHAKALERRLKALGAKRKRGQEKLNTADLGREESTP